MSSISFPVNTSRYCFAILLTFCWFSSLFAQPANDLCVSAEEIIIIGGTGTGSGSSISATSTGAPANCGPGVDNSTGKGVWYTFTGTGMNLYEITTCNDFTNFDTEISVFSGACGALSCITGNDNDASCGTGTGSALSTVVISPMVLTQYYVYVKGDGNDCGKLNLDINDLGLVCDNDSEAPVFSNCPGNISVNNDAEDCGAKVAWTPPTLEDNCPATSSNSTDDPGDFFPVGSTTVTYSGSDGSGNQATNCSFTITVKDTAAPDVKCPASIQDVVLNGSGTGSLPANIGDGSSTDNCSAVETSPTVSFTCSDVGTQTVLLTATDPTGNQSGTNCNFNVIDNLGFCCAPPVASCKNITIELSAGGTASINTTDVDNGSTAVCGLEVITVSPNAFDCEDKGTKTVTLTITDINASKSTCTANVTVEDNLAPTFSNCPGNINVFNDEGDCGAIASWTPPGLNDNCPGATFDSTHNPDDFFSVGTTTVTYTGSDAADNDAIDCSFTVSVTDNEEPNISCPANIATGTDVGECGAEVTFTPAIANDNCAVQEIKARYRSVDENNSATSSWTSRVLDPSGFFPVGRYQVQWRAKDIYGNKRTCSHYLDVYDDDDPVAVCKDVTVDFNGEEDINLTVSQVWNEAASSDNCGYVEFVSADLAIGCEELGNTVAIPVTIQDEEGNTDVCTSYVEVIGLPCGWAEGTNDGSLNCDGQTTADYDIDDESFTLTSDGCWHDCRESDKATFVYQELCGDGQLTAQLTDINRYGYAGLMARESLDPDARRAGVLKNYSTRRVRREYRAEYGGIVAQRLSNRSRVEWLRIIRTGNKIKSYTSTNGSSWRLLYQVTFSNLEDCIYLGMMTYSLNGSAKVEATFENVTLSGTGSVASDVFDNGNNGSLDPGGIPAWSKVGNVGDATIEVFPNPASDRVQLILEDFQDKPAQLIVRDAFGKMLRRIDLDSAMGVVMSLEVQDLTPGIYIISLVQDKQLMSSKKLVVQP